METKRYSQLKHLESFEDRYNYLKIGGAVGADTFGFDRIFNQKFYASKEWKDIRNYVITRDNGCDLGHPDYPIKGRILVHHLNPISLKDIEESTDILLDPEYLVCVSHETHNAIHYGDSSLIKKDISERKPNDTTPWKN